MLLIETRVAGQFVEKHLRSRVLELLRERGHEPLISSARASFFEQAAGDPSGARELERSVADWTDAEGLEPYVRGDLFCADEFALFLIFGDEASGGEGMHAGIAYDAETPDPSQRLEGFCRDVAQSLEEAARSARKGSEEGGATGADAAALRVEWRRRESEVRDSPARDDAAARQANGGAPSQTPGAPPQAPGAHASTARGPLTAERARASEIFEDAGARGFLQRLNEAHAEGRVAEVLAAGRRSNEQEAVIARLAGAGLVRREVQVSCKRDGRSLFRLPSKEALSIVTASNAVCSGCGGAIADERAEELVTPTPLAVSMFKDGAWLVERLRSILKGLGVPEAETFAREASEEGEAQLVANVSGEPILFFVRDGDFNAADVRRALEAEADAQATRLVVVSTRRIHDEARTRLREHARRATRARGVYEVLFVEGLDGAASEIGEAVERVAREALTRELYRLDAAAGFSVGYALAARFSLARRHKGEPQDLAASAAGALGGNLNEF